MMPVTATRMMIGSIPVLSSSAPVNWFVPSSVDAVRNMQNIVNGNSRLVLLTTSDSTTIAASTRPATTQVDAALKSIAIGSEVARIMKPTRAMIVTGAPTWRNMSRYETPLVTRSVSGIVSPKNSQPYSASGTNSTAVNTDR